MLGYNISIFEGLQFKKKIGKNKFEIEKKWDFLKIQKNEISLEESISLYNYKLQIQRFSVFL
jgi:hypothetical protein